MSNLFISKLKAAAGAIIQASKTVTAGTTQITVSPDTGYDAIAEVLVDPTPSTGITPSNSNPVNLAADTLYNPSETGVAIKSYTDVTPPSSSYTLLSSGSIYKINSYTGYLYRSAQSSGGMKYGFVFSGYRNNDSSAKIISVFDGSSCHGKYSCDNSNPPVLSSTYFSVNSSQSGSYYVGITFNLAGYVYDMQNNTTTSVSAGTTKKFGSTGSGADFGTPCIAFIV